MRLKLLSIFVGCLLVFWSVNAFAVDTPVPVQGPGDHSTISTSDGRIRDDELAAFVADRIKANGGKVKDVKIMANSCYGGGILDDFQRIFGPGGACAGIPWVGGSASAADQTARGWADWVVNKNPGDNLGSGWTDALAGVVTSPYDPSPGAIWDGASNNVVADLTAAASSDEFGPNHRGRENPVVGSGNGGENIIWNEPGVSHQAVVFGGKQTNPRHHNNIENVTGALTDVWAGSPQNIRSLDGGTTFQLWDAIASACAALDENTQLVLYFDDHGDTDFDVDEWWEDFYAENLETITELNPFDETFDLHEGWVDGLQGMHAQGDPTLPTLDLVLADYIYGEEWAILLNGTTIELPSGLLTGEVVLPVDWTSIQAYGNNLQIYALDTPTYDMDLVNLELSSGPINEIGEVPEPATVVLLGLGGLALLRRRRG